MLHIINNLPISSAVIDQTHSGDSIIFTDNAVVAIKQNNLDFETFTQKALSHINVYVRKADLLLSNISSQELLRGVVIIDELQYESAISQDFAIKSYN